MKNLDVLTNFMKKNKKYVFFISAFIVAFFLFSVLTNIKGDRHIVNGRNFYQSGDKDEATKVLKNIFEGVEKDAFYNHERALKENNYDNQDTEVVNETSKQIIYLGKVLYDENSNRGKGDSSWDSQRNNNKKYGGTYGEESDKEQLDDSGIDFKLPQMPKNNNALWGANLGTGGNFPGRYPSDGGAVNPPGNGDPKPGDPEPGDPGNGGDKEEFEFGQIDPNRANFDKVNLTKTTASIAWNKLQAGEDYKRGEILVKYKKEQYESDVYFNVSEAKSYSLLEAKSLFSEPEAPGIFRNKLFKLKVNKSADIEKACKELMKDPNIEYAQPNIIYKVYVTPMTPNDPKYSSLWGMPKIKADLAWHENMGSSNIIVGVSDTGIDLDHEDLKNNLVSGKNFLSEEIGTEPEDDLGHGTHVAGTIAAVGNNNIGVIGVAPKCKIMPLRIGGPDLDNDDKRGDISLDAAINSITYAADNGVSVINMSWGGPPPPGREGDALLEAIQYAYNKDVVLVAAAGNNGYNNQISGGWDIDTEGQKVYPAKYPETITVAATDSNDQRPSFSNYGRSVDVAAPGEGILSSELGNSYKTNSGTSMAAPHVSGLAALIRSVNPDLSNEEVREIIKNTADSISTDKPVGAGRINAYKAIKSTVPDLEAKITFPKDGALVYGFLTVQGSASGNKFNSYRLEMKEKNTSSWVTIGSASNVPVENGVLLDAVNISDFEADEYTLRLAVSDSSGGEKYDTVEVVVGESKSSFPLSGFAWSGLKVADLNNDGIEEAVFLCSEDYTEDYKKSKLYVIDSGGNVLNGFPIELDIKGWSSPALADLDGDEDLEIIVNGEYTEEDFEDGYSNIIVFHHDGSIMQGWEDRKYGGYVTGSPIVADLDGDKVPEILVSCIEGGNSQVIYQDIKVFTADGAKSVLNLELQPVYKNFRPLIQACTPVVGDVDNDGNKEIVIGDVMDDEGNIYILGIFDLEGNLKYKVKDTNHSDEVALYSRIISTDMYYGEEKEIIVVRATEGKDYIYMVKIDNGRATISSGWPKTSSEPFEYFEPVPVNIDGDSNKEIAIKTKNSVQILNHDGSTVSGWPVADNGGSIKVLKLTDNKELVVSNAVYSADGSKISSLNDIAAGKFVMDHAIGSFGSVDSLKGVFLTVADDGKEYIEIKSIDNANISTDTVPWPCYKKHPSNTGYDDSEQDIVPNDPPNIGVIGDKTIQLGSNLNFLVDASDPDGDDITVEAEGTDSNYNPFNPPSGESASFSKIGNSWEFNWDVCNSQSCLGNYPVKFTATDDKGASSSTNMIIHIIQGQGSGNNPGTNQTVNLINEYRQENGLSVLNSNSQLTSAAQKHSNDMAENGFCGHTGSDNSNAADRIENAGYYPYQSVGENVACGQSMAQQAVEAWKNSPGHDANMKGDWTDIGCAVVSNQWTCDFGKK